MVYLFFPISFLEDRAFFLDDPKSSEFRQIFENDSRCVSTSSWDVSSGVVAEFFFFLLQISFLGEVLSSQIENRTSEKTWCAPLS